jgi:F-type H+-transporting ATPase subunit delta
MSEQTVAFRYAKSLLDLAKEKNQVDAVYADFKLFDEVVEQNRDLYMMLRSPIVKHFNKLTVLRKIFQGRVNESTWAMMEIITRKNREEILPAVANEFQRQYELLKGIQRALVSTAAPLTAEQRTSIQKMVEEATGKSVVLQEEVKPDLIGGFVLRINDQQFDTSVRKNLNDLKVRMLAM